MARETTAERTDIRQKHTPLSDRVYELLASRIASGEYAANDRLPSETDLAEQFDVSRPVIRGALERLRQEGLIHSRQGAGSFVRATVSSRALGFAPVETIADLQRCYEFRLTLEPSAARMAAERHNEAALEKIAAALQIMREATNRQSHREDADFMFHHAIAAAANNHYFRAAMEALKDHIAVGMKFHGLSLMGAKGSLESVLQEHARIYDSIAARDGDAAFDAMHTHLLTSRNRLFEGRMLDLSL